MPQAQPVTHTTGRKSIDCRKASNQSNCSLKIAGKYEEVMRVAKQHAISAHGHKDGPELEQMLRSAMQDERE
jgi:hypothetical protein